MVVAEGDLAAKAGLEILERGGNAVDAAAAVSLALGVTNSGSCGIGGGGFMLIYWAKTGKVYGLDYRERAPSAARATMSAISEPSKGALKQAKARRRRASMTR